MSEAETGRESTPVLPCMIGPRPLIRTIAFDTATFDILKAAQRSLEQRLRRDTSNSEVIKYLLHTHPALAELIAA